MNRLSSSRRRFLQASVPTFVTISGCLSMDDDTGGPTGFADGFEGGFTGWSRDSDVPEDPNNPGNPVAWMITHSTERANTGSASLRFYLDGRQDDGTIWIVRGIEVQAGRAYDVSMRTDAWSPSESFNTIAHLVVFAGTDRPTSEGSFPEPESNSSDAGVTDSGGLRDSLNRAEGWIPYSFSWKTPELEAETIYIGVGISAVWETEMTYFIDDVKFTAMPR
ncbi:MAG: hypothetical protein ACOCY7_04890 [Halodesulfurarchaeum sp.]